MYSSRQVARGTRYFYAVIERDKFFGSKLARQQGGNISIKIAKKEALNGTVLTSTQEFNDFVIAVYAFRMVVE